MGNKTKHLCILNKCAIRMIEQEISETNLSVHIGSLKQRHSFQVQSKLKASLHKLSEIQ